MMTEAEYDQLEKILIDFIEESRRQERDWRIEEKKLRARLGLGPKEREKMKLRDYRNKLEKRSE